jgi:hypothetical protein
MRIICGTILAAVAAVMCVAEAKEYTLADRRARETLDWYRTGVMYQIQSTTVRVDSVLADNVEILLSNGATIDGEAFVLASWGFAFARNKAK